MRSLSMDISVRAKSRTFSHFCNCSLSGRRMMNLRLLQMKRNRQETIMSNTPVLNPTKEEYLCRL
jgi:hypothetical protein